MTYLNIAFYRFVKLEDPVPLIFGEPAAFRERLVGLRKEFQKFLKDQTDPSTGNTPFRGTILLAPEGINGFVASTVEGIRKLQAFIESHAEFKGLTYKESFSDILPFKRCVVKIKKEIISMGMQEILPTVRTGSRLEAKQLAQWLDQGHDDQGRPVRILDTRNDYEFKLGRFENSILPELKSFREFPKKLDELRRQEAELENQTVVMVCTGGIRCEKATAYALDQGLNNVYQLEGGILKYFEEVGGKHFEGSCFVFDHRVSLNPDLTPATDLTCYDCKRPLAEHTPYKHGCAS